MERTDGLEDRARTWPAVAGIATMPRCGSVVPRRTPLSVRVSRCELVRPLLVLKATMTVPTEAVLARPLSLTARLGPSFAADADRAAGPARSNVTQSAGAKARRVAVRKRRMGDAFIPSPLRYGCQSLQVLRRSSPLRSKELLAVLWVRGGRSGSGECPHSGWGFSIMLKPPGKAKLAASGTGV